MSKRPRSFHLRQQEQRKWADTCSNCGAGLGGKQEEKGQIWLWFRACVATANTLSKTKTEQEGRKAVITWGQVRVSDPRVLQGLSAHSHESDLAVSAFSFTNSFGVETKPPCWLGPVWGPEPGTQVQWSTQAHL